LNHLSSEAQLEVISREMQRMDARFSELSIKMDSVRESIDIDIKSSNDKFGKQTEFQGRIEGSLQTLKVVGITLHGIFFAWIIWVTAGTSGNSDRLTKLEPMAERVVKIEAKADTLNDKATKLEDKAEDQAGKNTVMESVPGDLKSLLAQVAGLQSMSARLDQASETSSKNSTDIAKINAMSAGMRSDLDNLTLHAAQHKP
jgi:hypothetical protein